MNTFVSALLGLAFAGLGTATVFLMYHLWGYPFDKATRTSAAPRWAMRLHRGLGFAFVALYIFMMWHMVPRLFRYQVEFPARTVAHIILGVTLGFILVVKLSIIRFFRHLEEWMPFLGTALLLCTWLLVALSVPFSFRERQLRKNALGGDVASALNLARVQTVLPLAAFPAEAPLAELATAATIGAGQQVLLTKCVECHDLKTILTRPRTPKDWVQTVERMGEKPVFGDPITDQQQWAVATYLIAITPELQASVKRKREQAAQAAGAKREGTMEMEAPDDGEDGAAPAFDVAAVEPTFDSLCTQCHELSDVEKHKWTDKGEAKEIMQRMVDNGLEATPKQLDDLQHYLVVMYVAPAAGGAGAGSAGASGSLTPPPSVPSVPAVRIGDDTSSAQSRNAKTSGTGRSGGAKTSGGSPATSAGAITPASALPAPAATGADDAPTCGKKPLPDCPLQAWMKNNAVSASASGDNAALAAAFDRIAHMAPPGYGSWASIAADGASAARSGDLSAARAACGSCHGQFRSRYKTEMRGRAIR